jgi:hypothetical protein
MKLRAAISTAVACTILTASCSSSLIPDTQAQPAGTVLSSKATSGVRLAAASAKRVSYYYQTQYSQGTYVSLAPLWAKLNPATHKPYATDLIVAAFHLGYDSHGAPYIHLNDNPPGDPMFRVMWPQVAKLQGYGVSARMMLGGAAQGSYAVLFSHWSVFYPILKRTIVQYKLNGIDLDVEETVSLPNIEKLINRLNADFGSKFIITLAPVASALFGGGNLSGFSYDKLYKSPAGAKIAWFDAQFYSGFATLASPADYEAAVAHGYPANVVVAGMLVNPADGSGFVPISTVANTVNKLVAKYPKFGGVAAWEYFNALPGGASDPAKWAIVMTQAMKH